MGNNNIILTLVVISETTLSHTSGHTSLSHSNAGPPITDQPDMSSPQSKKKRAKSASAPTGVSVSQFLLASLAFQFFLSYVITETWTWGYKSKWLYPRSWKYLIVLSRCPVGLCLPIQSSPLNLTEAELARYDGSDPNMPIYLAIEYALGDTDAEV